MPSSGRPDVQGFFDDATNSVSYLVWGGAGKEAVVIDPVLDFDRRDGRVSTKSADAILAAAGKLGLKIVRVLETHAHADHLSAAPHIKRKTGAGVGIGEHIADVQRIFRPVFNATDVSGEGAEFDYLFKDGYTFKIGGLQAEVLHTPGHTPACVSYRIGDSIFIGDTMFMPDYGTARADFPGGDARTLYRSIRRLLAFPPETRLFLCHDYKTAGRDHYVWETTVAEQRANNVQVSDGISEDAFVAVRQGRDATLATPELLMPAIQVNIRAGELPPPDTNGVRYLKLPVKLTE
jgi:glyoxylase-like metal-dependent hydrolase (beta-lactamase superfamily II)